jgi:hypothetical protein
MDQGLVGQLEVGLSLERLELGASRGEQSGGDQSVEHRARRRLEPGQQRILAADLACPLGGDQPQQQPTREHHLLG